MEKKKRTSNAVIYRYQKKTYKRYRLDVRFDSDTDIIDYLDAQESKNQIIKDAIRHYMNRK